MKQFHRETQTVANDVVEVAWRVLRMVKAEVGRPQPPALTLTQMRSLGFLVESPGASLSELAQHLGLQMPTTSKVVEELVQKGQVSRDVVPGNRRKLTLSITASGRKAVGVAAQPALTRMAELLAQLTVEDRNTVQKAMSILDALVQPSSTRDKDGSATHAA